MRADQKIDDTRGGPAIPFLWHPAGGCRSCLSADGVLDALRFCSCKNIGPVLHSNRSLGVLSDGDAGNPQARCLLLDTTRVGHDQRCVLHETNEVQIAQRINEDDPVGPRFA